MLSRPEHWKELAWYHHARPALAELTIKRKMAPNDMRPSLPGRRVDKTSQWGGQRVQRENAT